MPDARLQLSVTVRHGPHEVSVTVDAAPHALLADVLAACSLYQSGPVPDRVWVSRLGTFVDTARPIGHAELAHGDVLEAPGATQPEREPAGGFHLVVMGGPDAGRRRALTAGRLVVGRDRSCDLAVQDRSLSRQHF